MRPNKSRGLRKVGITAEGDNSTLGGHFLAGWSVLHALAHTPPVPAVKWVAGMLDTIALYVDAREEVGEAIRRHRVPAASSAIEPLRIARAAYGAATKHDFRR